MASQAAIAANSPGANRCARGISLVRPCGVSRMKWPAPGKTRIVGLDGSARGSRRSAARRRSCPRGRRARASGSTSRCEVGPGVEAARRDAFRDPCGSRRRSAAARPRALAGQARVRILLADRHRRSRGDHGEADERRDRRRARDDPAGLAPAARPRRAGSTSRPRTRGRASAPTASRARFSMFAAVARST